MRKNHTPTEENSATMGRKCSHKKIEGNTPKQKTKESTLKLNHSGHLACLPWLINEYKLKPNTEEYVLFTLKGLIMSSEQYSSKYCVYPFL